MDDQQNEDNQNNFNEQNQQNQDQPGEQMAGDPTACSVPDCKCMAYVAPDDGGNACKTCSHSSQQHTGKAA